VKIASQVVENSLHCIEIIFSIMNKINLIYFETRSSETYKKCASRETDCPKFEIKSNQSGNYKKRKKKK